LRRTVWELVRTFVLKAGEAHTSDDFRMKDLPSSSGRLDVVCRCLIASLIWNAGIRTDTVFITVMEGRPNPPLCLEFDGRDMKELPFSEIGLAAKLRRVLGGRYESGKKYDLPYWAGVSIKKKSFSELVNSIVAEADLYYLHEKGQDIRNMSFDFEHDFTFILGDQKGLTSEEEDELNELNAKLISVGPLSYLSSQVIALVHDELDRRLL
jgi:tRNA (pseudouridine54-N1)-methyltransferase